MISRSFARMATVAFTTKRSPVLAGGKRGAPVAELTSATLRCTPLDPADPGGKGELIARLITESTVQLLECFVDAAPDIRLGDILVVAGKEYPIKAVGNWEWRGDVYRALIVEDLQR